METFPSDFNTKSMVCWFPFKRAYDRRRIQPQYQDPPNVFYLKNKRNRHGKPVEVKLYEYGAASSEVPGVTELVLQGHPMPSDLLDLPPGFDDEDNSLMSDEDTFHPVSTNSHLATINPNCLAKEFWVDEVVEAGSLACVEEYLPAGRMDRSSRGRSASTKSNASSYAISEDMESLGRNSVRESKSQTESEYGLREQRRSFPQVIPVDPGLCGVTKKKMSRGPMDTRTRGDASSISNDLSTIGSGNDVSVQRNGSSGPRKMINFVNMSVEPPKLDPVLQRVLCGALPVARGRLMQAGLCNARQDFDDDSVIERNQAMVSESPPHKRSMQPIGTPQSSERLAIRDSGNISREGSISRRNNEVEPHFYVEIEAAPKQLQGIKDLHELQEKEKQITPLSAEVELARTSSLVDEDSAFMEQPYLAGVFKKLTPIRTKTESGGPATNEKLRVTRQRTPSATPPPKAKLQKPSQRSSQRFGNGEFVPPPVTPERQESRQSGQSSEHGSSGNKSARRSLFDDSRKIMHLSDKSVGYRRANEFIPQHGEVRENPSAEAETEHWNHFVSRRPGNGRSRSLDKKKWEDFSRPSVVENDEHPIATRQGRTRNARPDFKSGPKQSSFGSQYSEVGQRRARQKDARNIAYSEPRARGSASEASGSYDEDFELARFPSLSTEDWKQAAMEHMQVNRVASNIGSQDNESGWVRSDFDADFDPYYETNVHGTRANRTTRRPDTYSQKAIDQWHRDHVLNRTPSLDESFDNAVPFGPDRSESEESEDGYRQGKGSQFSRGENDSGFVIKSPRSPRTPDRNRINGKSSNWIDDEDSELNTEAFRKLAMDNDDDSIFHGLERTPGRREKSESGESSPSRLDFENAAQMEERSRGSIVSQNSGNSLEQSKYTSFTAGEMSKVSRGEISKYSGIYSKVSMLSRGDVTALSNPHSIVNEPFNCMDRWLDY